MQRPAPDFRLPDQNGTPRSLSDYKGRWVVLYFYPNDRSLNCTRQACAFRDEYRVINQFGNAEVIGINRGTVDSHKKFVERHRLNFPVLSDTEHKITSAFGAWRKGPAKLYDRPFGTRRNTYIIDPEGNIAKTFTNVRVAGHAEAVISALQDLQAKTNRA